MIAICLADGPHLHAFLKQPGCRIRDVGRFYHPRLLHAWLRDTYVHTVVLVDGPQADWYFETVLDHADLIVVPRLWLRHLPRRALTARARLAARFALDHRTRPLQQYVCTERPLRRLL